MRRHSKIAAHAFASMPALIFLGCDFLSSDVRTAYAEEPTATPQHGIAATTLPSGPYSSWPQASRGKAVLALAFRCALVSGMQLANYQGPKAAAQELGEALLIACVDHQMPEDWPDHGKYQSEGKDHFEKAKELDPGISFSPDDMWREMAQKLNQEDPGAGPRTP